MSYQYEKRFPFLCFQGKVVAKIEPTEKGIGAVVKFTEMPENFEFELRNLKQLVKNIEDFEKEALNRLGRRLDEDPMDDGFQVSCRH